MAEEKKEAVAAAAEGTGERASRSTVKLMGGVVGVIALGAMAAFMAVPRKEVTPHFGGPYSFDVITQDDKISANTLDNDNTRYLQLVVHCEYFAYRKAYLEARVQDPLYEPTLYSEVSRLIASKRLAEAMVGSAREAFVAELQSVLDPILFPVHVGDTKLPHDVDVKTGLRPGVSYRKTTFRGRFHDHLLEVDAPGKSLRLDDGSPVDFVGNEDDLEVHAPDGSVLHVDVTEIEPDFQGKIPVGIRGRIRRLNLPEMIAQ